MGIRRRLSLLQEDCDLVSIVQADFSNPAPNPRPLAGTLVPGIVVSDRPVGISLLISLTGELEGHTTRFRDLHVACKFMALRHFGSHL